MAPSDVPTAEAKVGEQEMPVERAARLKERVYVTFTALAVLMALTSHGEAPDAGSAALSLAVTTVGVLLAGFAADLISHSAVHASLPTARDLRHMIAVGASALGVIIIPLILLGLAGLDVILVSAALFAGQIVLAVSLGVFALLSLRRITVSPFRKLILALILAAIGAAVIGLEILAHTL